MTMEIGWYHEFHRQVKDQSDADAFTMGLDQVCQAEEWGLDAVWLAEIHQQAERSVMSSPLSVLATVAGRTTRLKLGTGVQVLPLTHPLRLAEETATVDQISRGRLLMGVGRSGNPRAYAAYGVPYSESRDRFFETLEVLKLAWTQTSFSFRGKYHNFDEARAVPRPFQMPHPPIRIAGASEDTFPVLGALGYPLFVAVRSGSLAALAPDLHAYREAYTAAGHKGKGEVHLRLTLHIAETDAEARSQAHDSIMAGYQKLVSQLEGSPNARRRAELETVRKLTYEDIMRDKVVIGSPDTVAARLSELQDEVGIDGILAELNFGAILPPEHMMRSLRLLLREVQPRMRPPHPASGSRRGDHRHSKGDHRHSKKVAALLGMPLTSKDDVP
jgi:alkanesulfonate monooxygenase SsuD/methylene tetrahydromethanopterin reductase-like flavin-dependent oxidoreductase (luciferase family)